MEKVVKEKKTRAKTQKKLNAHVADPSAIVAEEAYYLAEKRGFAPGHELDDWIEAERKVLAHV